MRNVWVLIQFTGFLLFLGSIVSAILTYSVLGIAGIAIASVFFIGGIFLFIFAGIKYRQETARIKQEGQDVHNPLL